MGTAVQATMWGQYFSFAVFLQPLSDDLEVSKAAASGAFSASALAFGAACMLTGTLSDRYGTRTVLSLCVGLYSLGFAGAAIADNIVAVWGTLGLMVGVGLAGCFVPLVSHISKMNYARPGLALGIVVSGAGIGGFVFPPATEALIGRFGWRSSYLFLAISCTLICVPLAQLLQRPVERRTPATSSQTNLAHEAPILHPSPWIAGFLVGAPYFMHGLFGVAILSHFVLLLQGLGVERGRAAWVLGLVGLSGILGSILGGQLADGLGARRATALSYGLVSISISLLLVLSEFEVVLVAAVLFGLSFYSAGAVIPTLVIDVFGATSAGRALGRIEFGWALGAGIGPLIAGLAYDADGNYRMVLFGGAALAAVA